MTGQHARPQCGAGVPAREIPDISPLKQRNKIVAGKSGSFRGAKAHRIEDEHDHEDEDDSQISGFRLNRPNRVLSRLPGR